MKRKLISFLMFGAVAIASTSLTSCKDYDDDINSLKTDINDLSSTVEQKETAIKSLINDIDGAYKAADEELNKAVEDGDKATLAAAETALGEAKTALETSINAKYDELTAKDRALDVAITKAQADATSALNLLDTKADKEEFQALQTNVTNISNQLANTQKELTTISTALQQAFGDLESLSTALKAQVAALEAVQQLSSENQAEFESLQVKLTAAEAELTAADEKIESVTATVNDVRTAAESRAASIDAKYEVITSMLTSDLRALVFMPYVYVDGIEAIPYPAVTINEFLVAKSNAQSFERPQRWGETIDESSYNNPNGTAPKITIKANTDYNVNTSDLVTEQTPYLYLPEIGVDYHMNPSSSNTAWENIQAFAQRDTRYTETTTRAISATNLVSPVRFNEFSNYEHFKNSHGILSVGMKLNVSDAPAVDNVKKVAWFEPANQTAYSDYEKIKQNAWKTLKDAENYIAALQATSGDINGANGATVTSDYAEVYGEDLSNLSISWAKENERRTDANDTKPDPWDQVCAGQYTSAAGPTNPTSDRTETANLHNQIFDNPADALKASPSIYVDYKSDGVSLGEYIQTCFDRKGSIGGREHHATWSFKEEEKYGFYYTFAIVEYGHELNLTNGTGSLNGAEVVQDHLYAHLDGDKIIANAKGNNSAPAEETAIGREPLVRVLLMHGDHVVKDAWILCRIVGDKDATVEVEKYKEWDNVLYDNCHGLTFTTPLSTLDPSGDRCADFQSIVIASLLKNEFDFLTFNGLYDLDGATKDSEGNWKGANVYKDDEEPNHDGAPELYTYTNKSNAQLQIAKIDLNVLRKNHTAHKTGSYERHSYEFVITLTADQVEALTHDQNVSRKDYSFYVRWNAKSRRSPYKHIYMKLTVNVRRDIERTAIQEKLDNYWFGFNGAKDGWDALLFNVKEPKDGEYPDTWMNYHTRVFQGNEPAFTDFTTFTDVQGNPGKKYFFVPQNTEITDLEGTTWVITPASGDLDAGWKTINCEKDVMDSHIWPVTTGDDDLLRVNNSASITDLTRLDSLIKWCNADYRSGAFTNKVLYAVKKQDYHNCDPLYSGSYVKIADLDQKSGEVTLYRTWTGDDNTHAANNALDMIVNAIGYEANNAGITKQFHSWVGLAARNDCDVAIFTFIKNEDNDKTFGIWTTSWERPINLVNDKPKDEFDAVKDGQSNGWYIPVYDLLGFYDWRGPEKGDMEMVNNKWLWAYYNINRIEIDLDPADVTTTMHGGTLGKIDVPGDGTPLSNYSSEVHLYPATDTLRTAVDNANLVKMFNTNIGKASGNAYNYANKSAALVDYLENKATNGKKNFGYIYYENNGLNVDEFVVRIPLNIYYEWGHFRTYVDVKINTTLGH